jgi:hypothetical protein
LQVVTSPCCPRQLPDVISNSLFLDAGSPTPAVHRVLAPVSSTVPSAFPKGKLGRLPAAIPLETTSCGGAFEVADIPLCSGLQVCSPPRSFLPLRILPQGSRGFYIRAYRALLPPHAPGMLTVRTQVIDGTGTYTLPDSQPCRLLTLFLALSFASVTLSRPCHVSSPLHVATQRADFPHYAPPFASPQGLWDLSCWDCFRSVTPHPIAVKQPQSVV